MDKRKEQNILELRNGRWFENDKWLPKKANAKQRMIANTTKTDLFDMLFLHSKQILD